MRTTTLLLLCTPIVALAQNALPYTSGFDDAAQQQGWQEFRVGHLNNYSWGITANGAASAPNRLWHDYPVGGSATDTVRDWYVSPPLDLSSGATFACAANVYAIMGSSMPGDACGVFLFTGSANPALATISPLADLLPLITTGNTYTTVGPLVIPATSGVAHIAFLYQSTQNWLTPGIDDIEVLPANVGVAEPGHAPATLSIHPRPATGPVTITLSDARYTGQPLMLRVVDARGSTVLLSPFRDRAQVELPEADGLYVCTVSDASGNMVARAAVERLK